MDDIDNTNRHFKGQLKNETLFCFCRKHWIVLLPYFIGSFVLLSATAVFFIYFDGQIAKMVFTPLTYWIIALIAVSVLTYYLHKFFIRLFNYYLQTIMITNFRIVILEQTLYFHSVRDSIDLNEIQDVEFHQDGIMQTLLNYGEIIITISSGPVKVLLCVPNPEYHFRKINNTKREYITNRRIEKSDPLLKTAY